MGEVDPEAETYQHVCIEIPPDLLGVRTISGRRIIRAAKWRVLFENRFYERYTPPDGGNFFTSRGENRDFVIYAQIGGYLNFSKERPTERPIIFLMT